MDRFTPLGRAEDSTEPKDGIYGRCLILFLGLGLLVNLLVAWAVRTAACRRRRKTLTGNRRFDQRPRPRREPPENPDPVSSIPSGAF